MADSVFIDRKVRFRLEPKTSVALKFLRNNLGQLLATQFRGRPLTESQAIWEELALRILGHIKPQDPDAKQETLTLVVNRR